MWYELFKQDSSVWLPIVALSLIITVTSYGAYPLLFARFRKKPITAKRYRVFCFLFNALVMVFFVVLNGSSSGAPYLLWTSIFCHFGKKTLAQRNVLKSADAPAPTPSSDTELAHTTNPASPTKEVVKSKKAKKTKANFCKYCGQPIDQTTKKCSGCGKQYFRIPTISKSTVALFTVVLVSVASIAFCLHQINKLHEQIADYNVEIDSLEYIISGKDDIIMEKNTQIRDLKSDIYFFNSHVVFLPRDDTKQYHKYDCTFFKSYHGSFMALDVVLADSLGYIPCFACNQ